MNRRHLLIGSGALAASAAAPWAFDRTAVPPSIDLGALQREAAPDLPGWLRRLDGSIVRATGYLAVHLGRSAPFRLISHFPSFGCPHCCGCAVPADRQVFAWFAAPFAPVGAAEEVTLAGRLDLAPWTDPDTGFATTIRLVDAVRLA